MTPYELSHVTLLALTSLVFGPWIIGAIAVRLAFPRTWWTLSNADGVRVASRWRWLLRWRFRRAVRRAARRLPRARARVRT